MKKRWKRHKEGFQNQDPMYGITDYRTQKFRNRVEPTVRDQSYEYLICRREDNEHKKQETHLVTNYYRHGKASHGFSRVKKKPPEQYWSTRELDKPERAT